MSTLDAVIMVLKGAPLRNRNAAKPHRHYIGTMRQVKTGIAVPQAKVEPHEMTYDEFYGQRGIAMRLGEISEHGAHFSTPGASTYWDTNNPDAEIYLIHPRARIANTANPRILRKLLDVKAQTANKREMAHIQELKKDPNANYMDVEQLGLDAAAKKLGYHGLLKFENDDIDTPTTVHMWDMSKVQHVGKNWEYAIADAVRSGKPISDRIKKDYNHNFGEGAFEQLH